MQDLFSQVFSVDVSRGFLAKQISKFCWSHLIRDVRFLCESRDGEISLYGNALLETFASMFSTLHRKDELILLSGTN
jgi:hypothetical protein